MGMHTCTVTGCEMNDSGSIPGRNRIKKKSQTCKQMSQTSKRKCRLYVSNPLINRTNGRNVFIKFIIFRSTVGNTDWETRAN